MTNDTNQATEVTDDPTSGAFTYTNEAGVPYTGTYAECGKRFVAAGCKGSLVKVGTVTNARPQADQPSPATKAPQAIVSADIADAFSMGSLQNVTVRPPTAPVAYSAGPRSSAQAQDEIDAQAAMIRSATGCALPPTIYPAGTELIPAGKSTYKSIAREWAAEPLIEDACEAVAKQIDAEKRRDLRIEDVSTLVWGVGKGDVLTVSRGGGFVPVEEAALSAFASRYSSALPRAKSLLLAMDVDQRADVLNRQTRKLAVLPAELRQAVLRGRIVHGQAQIFAAVSLSYTPRDGNILLRDYASILRGEGMRGHVIYDAEKTIITVRASWNAPASLDAHVGDVFNVGLYGKTGDAGNAGHSVRSLFTRIRCLNCTTVTGFGQKTRSIHTGSVDTFAENVRNAIRVIPEAFGPFAAAWGITRTKPIGMSVEDRIVAMVEKGEITASVGRDVMVEALLSAYNAEPGDTLADLLNAVTRAAHAGPFDEEQRASLEADAGRLVYVYADGSQGPAL